MQYIWEVVLAAEKNGIREADLQYEVPEVRSPYLEVSFYDLNTQTVEQTAVEVNPFYRFFDIFSGVLDINQKEYKKTKEIFVDAVFHEAVGEFAPVGHVLFQAFVHSDAKFVLPTKIRKKLLPLKSETLKITARQDEQGEIYPAGGHHSRPGARVAGLSETNL